MIWQYQYTPLPGNTDRYQAFVWEDPIQFQDFLPSNRFYAGSQFCVRERAKFELAIVNPALISVDKNWYYPRQYLGTYQINIPTGEIDDVTKKQRYAPTGQDNPYYNGFITYTTLIFERFNYITITDTTGQPRLFSKSHLDPCNYFSIGVSLPIGDITYSGDRMFNTTDIYTGRHYIVPLDLQSSQYIAELANLSFYIAPGAIMVSTSYEIDIINTIDNAASIEPEFSCIIFPERDCDAIYQDWLLQNDYFGSQGFCEAAHPGGCYLQMITYDPQCPPGEVWIPL